MTAVVTPGVALSVEAPGTGTAGPAATSMAVERVAQAHLQRGLYP